MYLNSINKDDPKSISYLDLIQYLEAMKYSGIQDVTKLKDLQTRISRLDELSI